MSYAVSKRHVPLIAVVNESTVVTDTELEAAVAALQKQVGLDFKPHYGIGAKLEIHSSVPANYWGLIILDDSDQAGALGYHDLTADGLPLGKVFAKTDKDNGYNWTITTSHELLEMLGDPWVDAAVQVAGRTFYALEVADACESDQYGYDIDGVMVSDFVLPDWFIKGSQGPYDFKEHISQPLELLPGGYIGKWTPTTGWTAQQANGLPAQSRRTRMRYVKHDLGNELRRSISEEERALRRS